MTYQYQNNPGYPPSYPPPQKSNRGLIIGLAAVATAAVVALVVVLIIKGGGSDNTASDGSGNPLPGAGKVPSNGGGSSGDSTGSAQALAQKVAGLIQDHATDEAEKLVCKPDAHFTQRMKSFESIDMTVTVKDVKESGSTAEATFTLVRKSDNKSGEQRMHLSQSGGKWCIGG